jgi:ribosomal protein L30/L7E
MSEKIAIILIRSLIRVKPDVKHTFKLLGLTRKNSCIVVDETENIRRMLQKVKDYATWGIINAETLKLLEKRKEEGKKMIRLAPPRKGFGPRGVKVPFVMNGALGNRLDKINDLISRMM